MDINGHTIYEACVKVDKDIKSDFGGGSPIPKTFLMSYLINNQHLKSFVEIGVYRGKSLFPTAYSIFKNGGTSYGIDPWSNECAMENDVDSSIKDAIDNFVETTDFGSIYDDVVNYREVCGYGNSIKIIRETSEKAIDYFKENGIKPDILHIDGNHDTVYVQKDFELYFDLMENGSFIIFDDIDWNSVKVVYEQAKEKCFSIFESKYFGILMKADNSIDSRLKAEKLEKKLCAIYNKLDNRKPSSELPLITVGMLTYNHERYVEEAINSVLSQLGNFRLQLIICDDCSKDSTVDIINSIIEKTPQNERLKINFYTSDVNLGMVANFNRLVNHIKASNCDFFSFCEGDDYYSRSDRLQAHLEFCIRNPQFALSYNNLIMYWQEECRFEPWDSGFHDLVLPTEKLATDNYIGNLNVSFIDGQVLQYVDDSLFADMLTGDWVFHIFCSQYGDIGHIDEAYNVYRKHEAGIWAGNTNLDNCKRLITEIEKYSRYLNFTYDKEFQYAWDKMYTVIKYSDERYPAKVSVAIIDDIFPHPMSGFRYQEFTSILEAIPDSYVYSSGESVHFLSRASLDELLIDYKREHPNLSNRLLRYTDNTFINADLLYCTFLGNVRSKILKLSEYYETPFVFTLYPGGTFAVGNAECDKWLKEVFSSPWFYKVIVTQDITYNYLIEKGFCRADQIERIFGVVVPLEKLAREVRDKKHYGIDKETLDVCFVAHKYTEFGQDKGYDIFIAAAKELSRRYDFVRFHVVGPWDENVISTAGIQSINFYGSHNIDWFDGFYNDKDIILSPNTDGKISKGSFDGFPTGCVTDAALGETAMFATDPLSLNNGRFKDGRDIVIVKHDVQDVVEKIEYYIDKPEELASLCKNGRARVCEIYSYESQLEPRIELLKDAAKRGADEKAQRLKKKERHKALPPREKISLFMRLYIWYITYMPEPLKRVYRCIKRAVRAIYNICPNIVKRGLRFIKRKIKKLIGGRAF